MNKTTYIIETSNTFDAAGTKLRKVAYDNSGVLISRTEYIGGIQYESLQPLASPPLATDLKFMSTGEGRVVKVGSNWNYEYFHKDHLGNTRVVYGYQKQVDEYKATMETQFATKEQAQFYNIATRRATVFNHTLANINVTAPDKSAETNGNTSKAIGPAKMLQVSAGDRVQLEVFAMYATGTGSNTTLISNLASAVTGSFLLNAGEAAHTVLTNSVPTQAATIGQTSGVPKAYLFYILLNSSYVYQQFGYVQVSSAALVGHQQLYLDVTIPTGGYLYTYVANESNISAGTSVYFDDFTIVHTRNTPTLQVLQTSDYYPFGLQIAAGSYQKQTALDNDYLYNGKELQDEHNLGWMDYGARMYMAEIGRFNKNDRAAGMYFSSSPYSYVFNNPINAVDPDGNYVIFVNGLTNIIGVPIMLRGASYWGYETKSGFARLFNGNRNFNENTEFVNGEHKYTDESWASTPFERYNSGRDWAIENYNRIILAYEAEKLTNPAATLNIVSHSQGAAFAEGIAEIISLRSNGAYKVNTAVHLQPSGAGLIRAGANTVDTRLAIYTQDDLVANKFESRMDNVDVEIYERYMKKKKISHTIKVNGENYNSITYKGSFDAVSAHSLNFGRFDALFNSIGVGLGATSSNKKTASIYHPHKFKKEY